MTWRGITITLACGMPAAAVAQQAWTALSPDGTHRAVVVAHDGDDVLEIEETRTGGRRTTLRPGGRLSRPVFSPDGHFVAFFVQVGDAFVLTVSDLRGHNWPVARTATAGSPPEWSADAVHIFFMDTRDGELPAGYRVTAGGTRLARLADLPATTD